MWRLTVNDHDLFRGFLLAEFVQDQVDCLAEHDTVGAKFFCRSDERERRRGCLDALVELFDIKYAIVPSVLQVLDGSFDRDNIMSMGASLNTDDAWSHNTLADDCGKTVITLSQEEIYLLTSCRTSMLHYGANGAP